MTPPSVRAGRTHVPAQHRSGTPASVKLCVSVNSCLDKKNIVVADEIDVCRQCGEEWVGICKRKCDRNNSSSVVGFPFCGGCGAPTPLRESRLIIVVAKMREEEKAKAEAEHARVEEKERETTRQL